MSDIYSRKEHTISVRALRVLPYVVLIKALVSLGELFYSAALIVHPNNAVSEMWGGLSFESTHIVLIAVYIMLLVCLRDLYPISDRMISARRMTILSAGLYCSLFLLSVLVLWLYSSGFAKATSVVFMLIGLIAPLKEISMAAAVMHIMKGFDEKLEKISAMEADTAPDESEWMRAAGRRAGVLGKLYLIVNIALLLPLPVHEIVGGFDMTYVTAGSALICLVIEIMIFASLRTAASAIWLSCRRK